LPFSMEKERLSTAVSAPNFLVRLFMVRIFSTELFLEVGCLYDEWVSVLLHFSEKRKAKSDQGWGNYLRWIIFGLNILLKLIFTSVLCCVLALFYSC